MAGNHRGCLAKLLPRKWGSESEAGSSARLPQAAAALIARVAAACQRIAGHGAVERAGIEMSETVIGGDTLAESALAGSRRTIDGNDHAAPFARAMPARISSAASLGSAQRCSFAHLPFSRSL